MYVIRPKFYNKGNIREKIKLLKNSTHFAGDRPESDGGRGEG